MQRTLRNLASAAAAALLLLGLTACGGDEMSADEHAAMGHTTGGGGTSAAAASPSGDAMSAMPGMTGTAGAAGAGMAGMAMDDGDGLSASREGYTLTNVTAPKVAGEAGRLTFEITGPSGSTHKEFVLSQTKLLHLYLVRTDLTEYQHIHPTLDAATGVWSVDLTIPQPGPYHLLAEFSALQPDHENIDARKLGTDFTVDGAYTPAPYAPDLGPWTVDGYGVALSGDPKVGMADLKLEITKDGKGVDTLESYLESFAHVTGFREGTLKAVHVHPNEKPTAADPEGGPELTLMPMFAEAGTYRLFVEFQTLGTLHTVPLDVKVA